MEDDDDEREWEGAGVEVVSEWNRGRAGSGAFLSYLHLLKVSLRLKVCRLAPLCVSWVTIETSRLHVTSR